MASATGSVGSKNAASGSNAQYDQSFMPSGAQRVSDGHGRYLDTALRGRSFLAANQAGVALSNLSVTCTGLCLTNPGSSGQYVSLNEVGVMQTSTASANANSGVQLAFGAVSATAVVHTTPVTVRNIPLGVAGTGVGLVDSAATLPAAPVAVYNIWQASVSGTATTAIPPMVNKEVAGMIPIAPGTSISLSNVGTAISSASHFVWEETPVNAQYS